MAYRKRAYQLWSELVQTIIAIGLFALTVYVVWYFDKIREFYDYINGTKWFLTGILALGLFSVLHLIWCRILFPCSSCADGEDEDLADTNEEVQSPYPAPGWKCISDFNYESDLKHAPEENASRR